MKKNRLKIDFSKNLLCLLLWLVPFTVFSQRYISGRITDAEDGSPIPAATVFFTNTAIGITTNAEGYYRLQIPGAGSYRLTISHVGYQQAVYDIDPRRTSIELNVAMQIHELDDLDVSAGIRFRQRDITLFWNIILGKNPSKRTIQATNPEKVYYFYNPETRILKVTCREPLEIINYETGYHIQYHLDYFSHDYSADITDWDYQSIFTELEPANNREKNNWEKKRKEVYEVSIPKFIKSLYNNTLIENGFALTTFRKASNQPDPRIGMSSRFDQSAFINPDDILSTDSSDQSKILHLANDQIMLISYGRPLSNYDIANIPQATGGVGSLRGVNWERNNRGVFRNLLFGDSIRIFPDGTYTNRLYLSPMDVSNPLLMGLCMTLPIEYNPENQTDN